MSPIGLLVLYVVFRLKHFICDFMLQSDWMALNKGKPGNDGYKALFSHTLIHASGTFIVMLIFAPSLWWLGLVDFFVHGVIDRLKGTLTYKKHWKSEDTIFWWAFGIDQELHNFTHITYIAVIFAYKGGIFL